MNSTPICPYCGESIYIERLQNAVEMLTLHIDTCPRAPANAVVDALLNTNKALATIVGASEKSELMSMAHALKVVAGEDNPDIQASLQAIDTLIETEFAIKALSAAKKRDRGRKVGG